MVGNPPAFNGLIFHGRHLFFGQIFPQPVYVKTGNLSWSALGIGVEYLLRNLANLPMVGISLLVLLGCVIILRRRILKPADDRDSGFVILTALVLAFIALTGGYWMEGGRYLVSFHPVFVLLALEGLLWFRSKRGRLVVIIGLFMLQWAGAVWFLGYSSGSIPAYSPLPADLPQRFPTNSILEKNNAYQVRDMLFVPESEGRIDRMIE